MADPFAILANSRVDVPGLLSVYQGARQARMQDMMFQRQMAREDRQEEADIKRQGVMARLFQPKGGGQSPQAAPKPQNLSPEAVGAGMADSMLNQAPQQLMDPGRLPPRTDGVTLNPDALRELYQIDPKGAMDIQTMFYNADKASFERAQANGETMYKAATYLLDLPPEQRAAAWQQLQPQLQGLGLSPEQLSQVDLSDRGLQGYAALGNSLSNITRKGGLETDYDFIGQVAGPQAARQFIDNRVDPIVQVTEFDPQTNQYMVRGVPRSQLTGQGGQGGAPVGPKVGEVRQGYRYNGGDPADRNSWEAVGGATPSASGNFR